MIKIPTTVVKSTTQNPRKLFIYSHPKIGKTSLVAQLPNTLLLDLEDGSQYVDAIKINVKEIARKEKISPLEAFKLIINKIKSDEITYDFVVIDTATSMEELAKQLGLEIYKSTPIGKNFKGDDVLTLPNGAGYGYLRLGFEKMYNALEGVYTKGLIILGHVKNASIQKQGKDLSAKDLALTGKLKLIVAADMDAVGYLYRHKETNQNILSFVTSEQDLATGARPAHLRGKEFLISELDENGDLKTYWNKIFLQD